MFGRRRSRPDKSITGAFGWLTDVGFKVVDVDWHGMYATFAKGEVLVKAGYHWHDGVATISVARRAGDDVKEQAYWSYVDLQEVIDRRAPGVVWHATPPNDRHVGPVFQEGSALLRRHAADIVAGDNLELLDDIILRRPQIGVPGLDFPTTEPWFASREGLWFFTDAELPLPTRTYLERSR
jgi:hypothetical protein